MTRYKKSHVKEGYQVLNCYLTNRELGFKDLSPQIDF